MRYVKIVDKRTGAVLADHAGWYSSPWRRFQGLMFRASLPPGEGIVITPCNSIHMAMMRFAIDVVFFDRDGKAVKLVHAIKPYRAALGGRRAHAAVELPSGTLERLGVAIGDHLSFDESET